MRNLLALIGLVVVVGGGVGWYMGWYKLNVSRGTEGNLEIKADVSTQKAGDDTSTFFKNAAATVGSHMEKQDAKTPSGTPGGTPGPVAPPQGSTALPPAPEAPKYPSIPVVPGAPSGSGRNPITLVPPK